MPGMITPTPIMIPGKFILPLPEMTKDSNKSQGWQKPWAFLSSCPSTAKENSISYVRKDPGEQFLEHLLFFFSAEATGFLVTQGVDFLSVLHTRNLR